MSKLTHLLSFLFPATQNNFHSLPFLGEWKHPASDSSASSRSLRKESWAKASCMHLLLYQPFSPDLHRERCKIVTLIDLLDFFLSEQHLSKQRTFGMDSFFLLSGFLAVRRKHPCCRNNLSLDKRKMFGVISLICPAGSKSRIWLRWKTQVTLIKVGNHASFQSNRRKENVHVNTPGPCISLLLSDLQITSQVVSALWCRAEITVWSYKPPITKPLWNPGRKTPSYFKTCMLRVPWLEVLLHFTALHYTRGKILLCVKCLFWRLCAWRGMTIHIHSGFEN